MGPKERAKFVSGAHDIRLLGSVVQQQKYTREARCGGKHLQFWMWKAGAE